MQYTYDLPLNTHRLKLQADWWPDDGFIDDLVITANRRPSLSWTGEANYAADGLHPESGNFSTTYTWRVTFTDGDNDAPSSIRVHILCNGSEITGSPFAMSYVSGAHTAGAVYSYSRTLSSPGNYTYYFDATDGWLDAANTAALSGPAILLPDISGYVRDPAGSPLQDVTVTLAGTESRTTVTNESGFYQFYDLTGGGTYTVTPSSPVYYLFSPSTHTLANLVADQTSISFARQNRAPVLSWTGIPGYTTDGVEPDIGKPGDTFVFRIKHTDPDNDTPKAGYPRLLLSKDGTLEETLPMTYVSGNNRSGALYSVSTVLDIVSDRYTYSFDGYDVWDTSATFDSAPVVIVCSEPPTMPENRSEVAKDGASCISAAVSLCWAATDPEGDAPIYTLYISNPVAYQSAPGRHAEQIVYSPVYTGTAPSYQLAHLQPGKVYYWKVRAEDSLGLASESPVFSFKTVDVAVDKTFTYPNPFNPTKQTTNIVFKTSRPQPVTVRLYSEYGDLVFETAFDAVAGTNEYRYDGRDSAGNMLYNGSYICRVSTQEGTSTCYILVIK